MSHNIYIYILVMAAVTYLIRMLPLALSRKEITSPFFRSFLYYVPYACLAAMTFPAILFATDSDPGSIVDISQLRYMLKKAEGYGYKKVGFILDRGYFGRENIQYMDECGYDFVIMVKGMGASIRRMILEN